MLPRIFVPQMFTAESAPQDERGYACPVCGRAGLRADEMAQDWSPAAWGYVPVRCLECAAGSLADAC